MPHESSPPTWWEKIRDNLAVLLLGALLLGLWDMSRTQQRILEKVAGLEKTVDGLSRRIEKIEDRQIKNGNNGGD